MRLIDADELFGRADEVTFMGFQAVERKKHFMDLVSAMVESCTTIDAVPVVRCKDCKYSRGLNEKERLCVCDNALICKNSEAHVDGWNPVWPDDFCSYGEKKEADGNGCM